MLKVLGGGFTKIADTDTYDAGNADQNGASVNYQIFEPGAVYGSTPRIEGTNPAQTRESIEAPVPDDLIDISGAFTQYRQITDQLAGCPATVELTGPDSPYPPLAPGWGPGTRARLALEADQTNVLNISAQDLANLAEITFADAALRGHAAAGERHGCLVHRLVPEPCRHLRRPGAVHPVELPDSESITVTGGDSLEGTIYAPNADLNWIPTANIEGNVIAKSFTHGQPAVPTGGDLREVHDFPFNTELSCTTETTTTTTTPTTETTPTTPSSETTATTATHTYHRNDRHDRNDRKHTHHRNDRNDRTTDSTSVGHHDRRHQLPARHRRRTPPPATQLTSELSTTGDTVTSELSTTGDTEVIAASTGPTLSNTGTPVTRLIPVGVVLALLGSALVVGSAVIRPKRQH